MKIFKYTLSGAETKVQLPRGAKILTAKMQNDEIVVWAIVDPDKRYGEATIMFYCVNTGADVWHMRDCVRYLNTVESSNGIVWHVFVDLGTQTDVTIMSR